MAFGPATWHFGDANGSGSDHGTQDYSVSEPDGGTQDYPVPAEPDGGTQDYPVPAEPDGGTQDQDHPVPEPSALCGGTDETVLAADHVFVFFHADPIEWGDDKEPVLCSAPRLVGEEPIRGAIDQLLAGPSSFERAAGVVSFWTDILGDVSDCGANFELDIVETTLTVRFCRLVTQRGVLLDRVLRRQIEQTVLQFGGIPTVEFLNTSGGPLFSGGLIPETND